MDPDLRNEVLDRLERAPLTGGAVELAERFFAARGDGPRARWLWHERNGYRSNTDARNLAAALGPDTPDELLAAVLRARLRRGRVQIGQIGPIVAWPHFFVEPIDRLKGWRDAIAHGGDVIVDLKLPDGASAPRSLLFPSTVFGDLLHAVALEIADAVRRAT
jgi:hypothetical protein